MPVIYSAATEARKRWTAAIIKFLFKSLTYGYLLSFLTTTAGIVPSADLADTIQSKWRTPSRLFMPTIRVEAAIEPVGVSENGEMATPASVDNAGWYQYSDKPSGKGNIVIDGHVDSESGPAVFYHLKNLQPHDAIYLQDNVGLTTAYYVTRIVHYPTEAVPMDQLLSPSNHQLVLITCSGQFDHTAKEYQQRLVVYASSD